MTTEAGHCVPLWLCTVPHAALSTLHWQGAQQRVIPSPLSTSESTGHLAGGAGDHLPTAGGSADLPHFPDSRTALTAVWAAVGFGKEPPAGAPLRPGLSLGGDSEFDFLWPLE